MTVIDFVDEPFSTYKVRTVWFYLFRSSVKYTVGTKTGRMVESMELRKKVITSLLESRYILFAIRSSFVFLKYVLVNYRVQFCNIRN